MSYYHIKLYSDFQKLCTIILQLNMGKYKYKRLPMGIKIVWFLMLIQMSCLSLSKIWNILRPIRNPDNFYIVANGFFKHHLIKLEIFLARLSIAGMRVNISKSKFVAEQREYLVYWITGQAIQPICSNFEAILNIKAPKKENHNHFSQFIGIVNYYRDMWFRRSELVVKYN
jgi:hypothetical protein